MINLSNLKTGQTKQLDGDVTVTKEDGHYRVVATQGTASLRFLKEDREWRFVVESHGEVEYHLPEGTTGKTAVETLIANWPAAPEAEEAPEAVETAPRDKRETAMERVAKLLQKGNDPTISADEAEMYLAKAATLMAKHSIDAEELRRAEGGEAGEGDDEVTEWAFQVKNQGGHAPHRAAAYLAVARAFGAGTYYVHGKVKGGSYKDDRLMVHVIAQSDLVVKIRDFFVIMDLAMERQAEQVSRRESSRSRSLGGHHSLAGCHARRGFMRGFGQGVADRLTVGTEEIVREDETGSKALVLADRSTQVQAYMDANVGPLKVTKAQKYNNAAYAEGRERGHSFASPAVEPAAVDREMINA